MSLPRIAVVTTGGTIDSVGTDRLDLAAYLDNATRLAPGELLSGIAPELATIARVHEVPFRRLRAHAITDDDLAELVTTVRYQLDREGVDGVVITHGTNTLEETTWLLHLVIASDRPMVLTGAMRPASALSGDGPLNLVNAVRLASSPDAARPRHARAARRHDPRCPRRDQVGHDASLGVPRRGVRPAGLGRRGRAGGRSTTSRAGAPRSAAGSRALTSGRFTVLTW